MAARETLTTPEYSATGDPALQGAAQLGGGADRPVLQPAGRRRGRGGGRGGGGGGGCHGCGPVPPSRGGGGGGGVSLVPHTLTGDLLAGVLAGVQPASYHTGRTTGLACNTQSHHRPL